MLVRGENIAWNKSRRLINDKRALGVRGSEWTGAIATPSVDDGDDDGKRIHWTSFAK